MKKSTNYIIYYKKFQIIVIGKDVDYLQEAINKDNNEEYFLLKDEIGSLDKKNPKRLEK